MKFTTKVDPGIAATYLTAWQAFQGVARARSRDALAHALIPTFPVVALRTVGDDGPWSTFLVLVYLASLAWALSWFLRACLYALYPDAPGAKVGLEHYVWRIALAWALTMLPAGFVLGLVEGAGVDPASAGIMLVSILAAVLTIGAMTLAAVTSAQVAVTGRFSPLSAYAALTGHRFASIGSFLIFLACAGGIGPVLALPAAGLLAAGVPEPLPTLLAGAMLHFVLLLGLAATSIAMLERARHADKTHPPAA